MKLLFMLYQNQFEKRLKFSLTRQKNLSENKTWRLIVQGEFLVEGRQITISIYDYCVSLKSSFVP
jgi:hypothetical protein